jgi:hypothetical protein
VGEDSQVIVWSLPEMATAGKPKVIADLTHRIPDVVLTGVQFVQPAGRAGPHHLITTAFDSHSLRVLLGL